MSELKKKLGFRENGNKNHINEKLVIASTDKHILAKQFQNALKEIRQLPGSPRIEIDIDSLVEILDQLPYAETLNHLFYTNPERWQPFLIAQTGDLAKLLGLQIPAPEKK